MALSVRICTLQDLVPPFAAQCVAAHSLDEATHLATVTGFPSAKPVRTIAPWLTATEKAEIIQQLMGEILHT